MDLLKKNLDQTLSTNERNKINVNDLNFSLYLKVMAECMYIQGVSKKENPNSNCICGKTMKK